MSRLDKWLLANPSAFLYAYVGLIFFALTGWLVSPYSLRLGRVFMILTVLCFALEVYFSFRGEWLRKHAKNSSISD